MNSVWEAAGQVRLDGIPYPIVRDNNAKDVYSVAYANEPPYEGGAPNLLAEEQFTWHLGGFKSRTGVTGTSEFGTTDNRWFGRMLPGPLWTVNSVAGTVFNCTCMIEFAGCIFWGMGPYLFRTNVAGTPPVVCLSKDFGANNVIDLAIWEDGTGTKALYATTSGATQSLWELLAASIVADGPDTWTQSGDVVAYRIASGAVRMFKISQAGVIKNIVTGLDPLVEANWADAVTVRSRETGLCQSLIPFERSVLALMPDGLYGVSEEGVGIPLLQFHYRNSSPVGMNSWVNWRGRVVFTDGTNLIRWVPGQAEVIGVENELINDSFAFQYKSVATDGKWLYALAIPVGDFTTPDTEDTYVRVLLVGRERESGEPGFGPVIWDSLSAWEFGSYTPDRLIFGGFNTYSAVPSYPALYLAGGGPNSDAYLLETVIPAIMGIPTEERGNDFAITSTRFLSKTDMGHKRFKAWEKFLVKGKNCDANNYIDIAYSLDGGVWTTVDVNAATIRLTTSNLTEFFLPTNIYGIELQVRVTITYDGTGEPPQLEFFDVRAKPRTVKTPIVSFAIRLEPNQYTQRQVESRTATAMLASLQAIMEGSIPVLCTGPWGENQYFYIRDIEVLETAHQGRGQVSHIVQLTLHQRELAS